QRLDIVGAHLRRAIDLGAQRAHVVGRQAPGGLQPGDKVGEGGTHGARGSFSREIVARFCPETRYAAANRPLAVIVVSWNLALSRPRWSPLILQLSRPQGGASSVRA